MSRSSNAALTLRNMERDEVLKEGAGFDDLPTGCPSCGRDNSEHGNVCTSDDCPAHFNEEDTRRKGWKEEPDDNQG